MSTSGQRSLTLAGWTITTTKQPILNAAETDSATAALHLPLPEICFGNNQLRIRRDEDGLELDWGALDALREVTTESGLKVAHAAEWARAQAASSSSAVSVQKPFDWTYTTLYPGRTSRPIASTSQLPLFESAPKNHPGIPLHKLARMDVPIAFYDEIPLYEDELGDNGIAELVVRVRVNATSFFVLSRFFLRIDHVLFRIFDVRIYHEFNSKEIIRERKGRQASYDQLKQRLPIDNPDDLSPLTDINWVYAKLESLASASSAPTSSTRSRVPPSWPPVPKASLSESGDKLSLSALELEGKHEEKWSGEGVVLEVMLLK